jgi:molybdopterin-guanine dinucleotide biosynthesis protein A
MSLHVYILAGGKSTRMGEEKGLVIFQGKALIQHVIDVVKTFSDDLFIVTDHHGYEQFHLPLIADLQRGLGPAGAIDTILHHSQAEQNLVIACDMPFIDSVSIQFLIDQSRASEITVPQYRSLPEGLFAIYNTSCKQKWHTYVETDILKLSELLSHFETNFVDGNKMSELNPHLFKNMNSQNDLSNI